MRIEEITSHRALSALLETEGRGVVLDFWGTWCQPCRSLRPHLETLADEFDDQWTIVAVHVEGNVDLVEEYGIRATPTLVYVRAGTEVHRSTGAVTPSGVAAALAEYSI
jgi:thioredoxin